VTRAGQISDDEREEFILASDVLGLSMLVVQMNHRLDPAATPATVLGPFHIEGSPELGYGEDMSDGCPVPRCTSTGPCMTSTEPRSPAGCSTSGRPTPRAAVSASWMAW
jgi:hypothetical protein